MYDKLIINGEVFVDGEGFKKVNIGIKEGKISDLFPQDQVVEAEQMIDAKGRFVLPGAIDPHVHFGIYTDWAKDFKLESQFAASGGVTSVINYFRKKGSYLDFVPEMIKQAEENSVIDFGLHLGLITNQHVEEIGKYIENLGVSSYKIYSNYMGRVNQIFDTDDGLNLDDGDLDYLFKLTSEKYPNAVLCVHCENMEITKRISKSIGENDGSLSYHELLSPGYSEAESVMSTLYLANQYNAKAYIVHVSAKETTQMLEKAPFLLKNAVIETCPHYLAQSTESDAGILAKVNPPVRPDNNKEDLWEGIRNGIITSFGSDNCSCLLDVKGQGRKAKPGFASTGLNLPVLLSEGYHKRDIKLETIAKLISENPAKAFNLYPRKGSISVGADADLIILDMNKEKVVKASELYGSSDFSIYENRKLKGWPVITLSRGEVIFEDDKIVGRSGRGKFLNRA